MAFTGGRVQFHVGQETFGVLGVISQNVRTEFDFAARLANPDFSQRVF